MNNFVQKSKDDFILSQVLMMTHAATLQRNKVYLDSATEIEKKKFRENLSALLLNLLADYKKMFVKIGTSRILNLLQTV